MSTLLTNLPEILLSLAGLIAGFVVPDHIDQRMKERGPAMAPVTTIPGFNTFAWDYAIALVTSRNLDKSNIVRVASIITDGIKDGKSLDHVSRDAMDYVRHRHMKSKNTRVLDTAPGARSAPGSAYELWEAWLLSKDDNYAKMARERAERFL